MNITLTPKLAKIVKKQLLTGRYSSAREVIGDALKLLKLANRTDAEKLKELRREIAIGWKQAERGELIEFDDRVIEEVCRSGSQRQRRRK